MCAYTLDDVWCVLIHWMRCCVCLYIGGGAVCAYTLDEVLCVLIHLMRCCVCLYIG